MTRELRLEQHPQRIRLAVDLVRVEPADAAIARHLLGNTVVVDDLATPPSLHRVGPAGIAMSPTRGEVLEADGTLRAGPLTAAMGLISRRSELEALAQQIAEVDARIASSRRPTDRRQRRRQSAWKRQQNSLRNAVYQSNTVRWN